MIYLFTNIIYYLAVIIRLHYLKSFLQALSRSSLWCSCQEVSSCFVHLMQSSLQNCVCHKKWKENCSHIGQNNIKFKLIIIMQDLMSSDRSSGILMDTVTLEISLSLQYVGLTFSCLKPVHDDQVNFTRQH